ncbi:hypothetical protein [Pseudoalteromonas ruthenica]|uniref:hypothetical protein n=1 Tax=Pseudoalteromonas ruthenica TaxID=151081 RepID=UPI0003B720F9|nr:hypothetical protein [Pseudoalteromonas ruthenica]
MKKTFLEQFYFEILSNHSAKIALSTTLLFPSLGFIYEYLLLRDFGINVIMFSSPSDFLLSAFKKPIIPIAYVIVFFSFVFIGCLEAFFIKNKNSKKGLVINIITPTILLILTITLIVKKAEEHSKNIKNTNKFYISLDLKKPKKISNHPKDLVMISASGDYIFLYQRNGKSHIIPKSQIISITQIPYNI